MKWWSQNEQHFKDNEMEYINGISVCSAFEIDDDGVDIFKPKRDKSRDELWNLIKQNIMEEGVAASTNWARLKRIKIDTQHYLNNIIHILKDWSNKTPKVRQQMCNMLIIFDSNENSVEFLYGFFKINIEKTQETVLHYATYGKILEISTNQRLYEIKFIDINCFTDEKTLDKNWKETFEFLVNQNVFYNCNLLIKIMGRNSRGHFDKVFNLIENCFESRDIKTISKEITNMDTIIFDGIPLSSLADCQIKFNQKFWHDFCSKQGFLNDVDLLGIEAKIYDFILMCNSSNKINKDYEKVLESKGWIKLYDTFSDSWPKNINGYVGVAFYKLSGLKNLN